MALNMIERTRFPGEDGLNGRSSTFFPDVGLFLWLLLGARSQMYGFFSKYDRGCKFSLNSPPLNLPLCFS